MNQPQPYVVPDQDNLPDCLEFILISAYILATLYAVLLARLPYEPLALAIGPIIVVRSYQVSSRLSRAWNRWNDRKDQRHAEPHINRED